MADKELSFLEKIMDIQGELKAPKDSYNDFGKYKFRSAEDILEKVKPLLKKHKLALFLSDTVELKGDWHYIVATVELTDGTNTKTTQGWAREEETKKGMDASQITGSCSSYARKYALNGMFDIDNSDEDPDSNAYQTKVREAEAKKSAEPKKVELVKKEHIDKLQLAIAKKGRSEEKLLEYYGLTAFKEMSVEQWENAMSFLEK